MVSGARMIATLGPVADEVLIYNIPGIPPEDRRHALVFAVPIDAPGLRQICREPYDGGEKRAADHPLAANFEEPDSLMIFDEVLVPWDRVFVYNDAEIANAIFPDTSLRSYTAPPDLGARPGQAGVRGRRRDGGRPRGQDRPFSFTSSRCSASASRRSRSSAPASPGRKCITSRHWRGRSAPKSRRCLWRAPTWPAPIPG